MHHTPYHTPYTIYHTGISPDVTNWNKENTSFHLVFSDNPLVDFVELPPHLQDLSYCNLLAGVIKVSLGCVACIIFCV
ncbi:hypothetical protein EON63_22580 [archaeon]|nr:MAG: hypothetical protein EON63_22580 [archaeon]